MLRSVTLRSRTLAALAVALLFVLVGAASPPETVLSSPGPDQLAAAGGGSTTPGERSDRLADASAATTPASVEPPARTPDGRLPFVSESRRRLTGHRDRIDRPPRALA